VALGSASLDWTVAPRFEVGYRLPSGFGAVSLAYRFLVTEGTETAPGPDAPATLKSRFDLNQIDLDYTSAEFSLLHKHLEMRVHFGLRYAYLYFDTRSTEPFAAAAAGMGVFEQHQTNSYVGFGPHTGVELVRPLDGPLLGYQLPIQGLAVVARSDIATLFGRIRQGFCEKATARGPDGQPLTGTTNVSSSMTVPTVAGQIGLGWQPHPDIRFFAGYQAEYWWNVGRLSTSGSRGELAGQGIVLQGEYHF
jgi:hypothetical protein